MLLLKYLLVILGIGLFGSSGSLIVYDIYLSSQLRRLLGRRRDEIMAKPSRRRRSLPSLYAPSAGESPSGLP